jgi:hypothetical protein
LWTIRATEIEHGKRPSVESFAQDLAQLDVDLVVKHVVAGDDLTIGRPGIDEKARSKLSHEERSTERT